MQVSGNRVAVEGALTLDTAAAVREDGSRALDEVWGESSIAAIDMSAVAAVDSSALAVVFAWMREAHAAGKTLELHNPPQQLLSLAAVYGAGEMLPLV